MSHPALRGGVRRSGRVAVALAVLAAPLALAAATPVRVVAVAATAPAAAALLLVLDLGLVPALAAALAVLRAAGLVLCHVGASSTTACARIGVVTSSVGAGWPTV